MNSLNHKQLIVIVGPTAVGKTELSVRLAEHLRTEIISADSRQIFSELNVGTAKPTVDQLARVRHHLVGTQSIRDRYHAALFGEQALKIVNQLFEKYDQVILSGGPGLYIQAVLKGFDEMPEVPPQVRALVRQEYRNRGLGWLQEQVRKEDPEYFESVDRSNPQRLMRALELVKATGQRMSAMRRRQTRQHPFRIVKIGLELPLEQLYQAIELRVDRMITDGLIEEVKGLREMRDLNALQTVGYQEVFSYLDGAYDLAEMVQVLKRNSRRYAKRQMTWFRNDPEIKWYRPDRWNEICKLVRGQ